MAVEIKINTDYSESEIYKSLIPQLDSLISESEPIITGLSNLTAALKEAFQKISWVGFYFQKDDKLFLGPFQGKTACTVISLGSGVCGTSAKNKETIIVEDVNNFVGHIACDSGSRSEIVIPIIQNDKVVGVLDLDSYNLSAFNQNDQNYLEQIAALLTNKFDFSELSIF